MRAAALVCAYLVEHKEATRPELRRALGIHEKSIESAIRKLIRLGFVADSGRKKHETSPRPAIVYVPGEKQFDQKEFSKWVRGTKENKPLQFEAPAFDALQSAMNQLVWTRAA